MSYLAQNFIKPSLIAGSNINSNGGWKFSEERNQGIRSGYLGTNRCAAGPAFPPYDRPFHPASTLQSTASILPAANNVARIGQPPSNSEAGGSQQQAVVSKFAEHQASYEVDQFSVDERVVSLTGPYLTLSNYYVAPIFVKRKRYRSVEHYVYEKYFGYLKLPQKRVEKILTTTDPAKLSFLAMKFIPAQRFADLTENETSKLLKWYDRAMRRKLSSYEILRRGLLATGDALIIETNNHDSDHLMTIGTSEINVLSLLSRVEITPATILRACLRKRDIDPNVHNAKFLEILTKLGQNQTGLILMRMRKILQLHQVGTLDKFRLNPTPPSRPHPAYLCPEVESSGILCFTDCSFLHPKYLSPFWTAEDPFVLYPTVDHYVYAEAAKFFCFPQCSVDFLMQKSPEDICRAFFDELKQRFPDPIKFHDWCDRVFEQSLIAGCRAKFHLHPTLLKRLVDTNSAMLVYCRRHTTATSEQSVGSRESELREWLRQSGVKPVHLVGLMTQDFAKRVPFLGANRLGFILMAIRREFTLKGSPVILPMSAGLTSNEIAFGEANDLEEGDDFEPQNFITHRSLWPSPFVMLNKKQGRYVWYPRKRKLPGFYADSQIVEQKRKKWTHRHILHPEYDSPVCPSTGYPIDQKIVEFNRDHPSVLIEMISDLTSRAITEKELVDARESDMSNLLDEIADRNSVELCLGQILKIDDQSTYSSFGFSPLNCAAPSLPVEPATDALVSRQLSNPALTSQQNFSPKMLAMRSGFERYLRDPSTVQQKPSTVHQKPSTAVPEPSGSDLDRKPYVEAHWISSEPFGTVSSSPLNQNAHSARPAFQSIFDSAHSTDESDARFLIDNLYRHLNDDDKLMALEWLKHAAFRVRELRQRISEQPLPNQILTVEKVNGKNWRSDDSKNGAAADLSTLVPQCDRPIKFSTSATLIRRLDED